MDRASRVARQKEREVITKPPVPLMADKYASVCVHLNCMYILMHHLQ